MELKQFQADALKRVESFIKCLAVWRDKARHHPELVPDFPRNAWVEFMENYSYLWSQYHSKKDGLNRPMPNFGLKIPTGGGKTLLGVRMIDLYLRHYRRRTSGLVLWIVPSDQIYRQTLKNFKDKLHPYRHFLDNITGNRVKIVERQQKFTEADVETCLVVLVLMLPAANRESKETLRMFRDSGGYDSFFPCESDTVKHREILTLVPNLDSFMGSQIITSLGNAIRINQPLIILDEGHKGYSEKAQDTLSSFNPSMVIELSATPQEKSNSLVKVSGRQLEQEDMLKLDLHVDINPDWDWSACLRRAVDKRNYLENLAKDLVAEQNRRIRPIMLIQVDRTSKDKRDDKKFTHADQIKDYLHLTLNIPSEQIAIKSGSQDDLKSIDDEDGLMAGNCPVRYIITKSALQEGWDCPFAYVLTVLAGSKSLTALTQLVGRVLRQPDTRKTDKPELNESYVFLYRQNTDEVFCKIKAGFEGEGLGDLVGNIHDMTRSSTNIVTRSVQEKYKNLVSTAFLPIFACRDPSGDWRPVSYAMDIEQHLDWPQLIKAANFDINLVENVTSGKSLSLGLDDTQTVRLRSDPSFYSNSSLAADPLFFSRILADDLIPNSWYAFDLAKTILEKHQQKYTPELVAQNLTYLIEQTRSQFQDLKNSYGKSYFEQAMKDDFIRFTIISNKAMDEISTKWFQPRTMPDQNRLTGEANKPIKNSLFDFDFDSQFNQEEKNVIYYLEAQEKLLFWWRNEPKQGYALQGWQRNRIFPDFIFGEDESQVTNPRIFVVETKGIHLIGSEDTQYKTCVFSIAEEYYKRSETVVKEFSKKIKKMDMKFSVISSQNWNEDLRQLIENRD